MKKILFFAALTAALSLVSCKKEFEKEIKRESISFTATTESATKTALEKDGDNYNVVWRSADLIAIVDADNNKAVYSADNAGTSSTFSFQSGAEVSTPAFKAYYPAAIYDDGTLTLPSTQKYAAGNIAESPMYAESTTTNLNFKNLCGIVRLNLTTNRHDMTVKGIQITADQGMSGVFTVSGNAAEVSGSQGVFLDCSEGVGISSTSVPFHLAIPASSYTGLKITVMVTDDSGKDYKQCLSLKSDKSIIVERSKITDISLAYNDFALDLGSKGKNANTYCYSEEGRYCFDATVKGNGGLDPLTGTDASRLFGISGVTVLWEVYDRGRAIDYSSAGYDISYSDGYVYFRSPSSFRQGDAYVAVYRDGAGGTAGQYEKEYDEILWSWLIWATSTPGTVSHNGKDFMDRNIGSINIGNYTRGFLYEWGRKDPFSAANGDHAYYDYVPSVPEVFGFLNTIQSMAYTIAHPTDFVFNDKKAWMSESEYNLRFWREDVKTIYDPCPYSWRLPAKNEISNISALPDTGLTNGNFSGSYNGFGNPSIGYYRTSTLDVYPKAWSFCNDGRNMMQWETDTGFAIRPVKE